MGKKGLKREFLIPIISIKRLFEVEWISNIGKFSHIKNINSEEEFIQNITSLEWENTVLEVSNLMGSNIRKKYPHTIEWNLLAEDARNVVESIDLSNIFIKNEIVTKSIIDDIKINCVFYLIESAYHEKNLLPLPLFFNRLIEVYERGHIPCGIKGDPSIGKLLVY